MTTKATLKQVLEKHNLPDSIVSRYRNPYQRNASPNSKRTDSEAIHLRVCNPGSPAVLPFHVENLLVDVVKYYIKACMPLIKSDLLNLVVHILRVLSQEEIKNICFNNVRPPVQVVKGFFSRYKNLEILYLFHDRDKKKTCTCYHIWCHWRKSDPREGWNNAV